MIPATLVARQPVAARPITEIIVHCTATPEGREVSLETIRDWHKARGFSDIGYHYVVHLDGSVERGRAEALVGAHVSGHNTGTLGVVYVGGIERDGATPKDTRTPAQRRALIDLVSALIDKYPAVSKVSGHNEYAAKACPSFDVRTDPLGALAPRKAPAVAPAAIPPTPAAVPRLGWLAALLAFFTRREGA